MLPYIVTQVMSLILFVFCNALVNLKLLILSIKSNCKILNTLDKLVLNTTNKLWTKLITLYPNIWMQFCRDSSDWTSNLHTWDPKPDSFVSWCWGNQMSWWRKFHRQYSILRKKTQNLWQNIQFHQQRSCQSNTGTPPTDYTIQMYYYHYTTVEPLYRLWPPWIKMKVAVV